ncbi:hypothetical protein KEM09_14865 [Carboxylicivirga mesophila]|uniref:DUF4625 domain-containing protein n=1 Tax=Carboxylicivirga mesophila TaxID=1166478 RepID=A0ABS5KCG7_9BACT|nr:hypothetical protein [Carboxylicivirga mesophila]MBS2212698.1 hypothetical protein [Carboxylicivirga mesophila]
MYKYILTFITVFLLQLTVSSCDEDAETPTLSRPNILLDESKSPIITETSAEVGCRVYTDGGSPIKEVGVLWQLKTTKSVLEMQFPELEGDAVKVIGEIEKTGVGAATALIEGFAVKDTAYIIRMYAINTDGQVGYSYPTRISNNLSDY